MALLVTVDEFKEYANLTLNTSRMGDKVEDLLYYAQACIWLYTDYCERATVTGEYHDSSRIVFPYKLPIISISKVYVYDVELDEDEFFLYDTYIRVPSISTKYVPHAIKLDYVGGVSREDVEPDPITGVDTSTIGYKYTTQAQMAIKQVAGWALENKRDSSEEEALKVRDMILKYLPKVVRI